MRQRSIIAALTAALCAAGAVQSQVEVVKDLAYLDDAGYADDKDKLDVYRPSGAEGAPVFVFIHGGGLLRGDKDQQGHVGQFFAEHGFVVVCINHRLSPGVIHPAHAEDAAASLRWVAENISDYGGDPRRIALGGHSAGAYLAALIAFDSRFLREAGSSVDVIRALVPISGFFWVERLAPSRPKTVWGESVAGWRGASPSRYLSTGAPATLLVWADGDADDRRKESRDLASALRRVGAARVETTEIADRDHGSIWSRIGSDGDPTGPRIVDFLNDVLNEGSAERSDLQGVWDYRTITPLQRPPALSGLEFFSKEDAAAFERQTHELREKGQLRSPTVHMPEWLDYGNRVQRSLRTSLVVDPPNGRIPALTVEAVARLRARRQKQTRSPDGHEDRSIWERCLLGFNSGPPMNPGAYNNNVMILQNADTVVLLNEMIHEARIVPLAGRPRQSAGRPRLSPEIRLWRGDSRGHWEGDTLVVETTNFNDRSSFMGSSENLRLTERFTRLDESTLLYRYTVDDPESFESAWSAEIVMGPGGPVYEFACHEGNYGLRNILQIARAADGVR